MAGALGGESHHVAGLSGNRGVSKVTQGKQSKKGKDRVLGK